MMSGRQVKKRAVNLFVDAELLDEARRMRINVSETLERRLLAIVRAAEEKALARRQSRGDRLDQLAFIERHGLLASKLRYRPDEQ